MKNFLQVNRALAAEKNFLLFNQSFGTEGNPNQTGKTLTPSDERAMTERKPRGEKEQLSSTCLRSASELPPFRSRYLRYAAMIFAVLVMSIANIGMAWGATITWDFTSSTADIGDNDVNFEGSDGTTILTYRGGSSDAMAGTAPNKYLKMNGKSTISSNAVSDAAKTRIFKLTAPSSTGTISVSYASTASPIEIVIGSGKSIKIGNIAATANSTETSNTLTGLTAGTTVIYLVCPANKSYIKSITWTDVTPPTYSSIYYSEVKGTPTTGGAFACTGGSEQTGGSGSKADFAKYYSVNNSKVATFTFATPLALNSNGSNRGVIRVYYSTKNASLSINGGSGTSLTAPTSGLIDRYEYTIPNGTTSISSIALTNSGGANGLLFYAVDVLTYPAAACSTPANPDGLSAGSLTATGATFTITDDESPASYDIYYSTESTAPTSGTSATTTSTSKTKEITGLTAATTYYAWVRAVCDGSHKSDWVALGGGTFTTKNQYTITYNKDGATESQQPNGTKTEGENFTLSSTRYTKSGKWQVGWATSSGGSKAYDFGGTYSTDAALTLYPAWVDAESYTFDYSEGKTISQLEALGWTFNSKTFDGDPTDGEAYVNLVSAMNTAGLTAPKSKSMADNALAFAKSSSAYALYDIGEALKVYQVKLTLYGGSSSSFNGSVKLLGSDGSTVKQSETPALSAGDWKSNTFTYTYTAGKADVQYIQIFGASKWIVMYEMEVIHEPKAAAVCPSAYSFTYKNTSTEWTDPICFTNTETSDGNGGNFWIAECTLPTDGVSFKLGWEGTDNAGLAKTTEIDFTYMPYELQRTKTFGVHPTAENTGGAEGYLRVRSSYGDNNKYIGFIPSGYVLRTGSGESWTSTNFEPASEDYYEENWSTPLTTLSASTAAKHYYVGLKTSSGYVWSNAYSEDWSRLIFLQTKGTPTTGWRADGAKMQLHYWKNGGGGVDAYVTMTDDDGDGVYEAWLPNASYDRVQFKRLNSDMSSTWNQTGDLELQADKNMYIIEEDFSQTGWGVYEQAGKFHIYASSTDKNWYLRFKPHYVLTYDANTGSGTMTPQSVAADAGSKNVTVLANGFTAPTGKHFVNWNTAPGGGGTSYAPSDSYSLTADATLYAQWANNQYSVTHSGSNRGVTSGTTGANAATYGTAYTAVFSETTGYNLPATITVTIGGNTTTQGTEYTWNQGTGTVVVDGDYILGDVVITVNGVLKTYTVNFASNNVSYGTVSSSSISSVPHGSTVSINGSTNALTLNGSTITVSPTTSTAAYTYAFDHWSVANEATITSAQTITATFTATPNDYTVTHTLTNVTTSSDETATYGTDYTATFSASSGYELPDDVTVTIGGDDATSGTEYTWNASTGALTIDGDYILGDIVVTIVGESEGCTPQSLSKVVLSASGSSVIGTATGYNYGQYTGTPEVKADYDKTDDADIDGEDGDETGYKMGSGGNSIVFATLKGTSFQEGDVVKIGITRRNDTREISSNKNILTIYYGNSKSDADSLTTISTGDITTAGASAHEGAGFYEYELTAADATKIGSKKGIGLFRASKNGENPYVYSVEIIGCREWSTCTAPTAVSAGTITSSGATFTITDAENTNNYEIYYSTSSTTPTAETSATVSGISTKSRAITGLTASTIYYYWVRSNCGGATKSSWVAGTPASFTTATAAATHNVTYNGNDASSGSVPTDATAYEEGDVVTVLGNTGSLVKTGQTFLGWSTSSTASTGTFYPAGYKFYMPNAAVTLYAVWGSTGATCVTLTDFETGSHDKSSGKPDSEGKYFYGYKGTKSAAYAVTITTPSTGTVGANGGDNLQMAQNTRFNIYADNTTTGGTPATFSSITSISFKIKAVKNTKIPTIDVYVGSTKVRTVIGGDESSGTDGHEYDTSDYTTISITGLASLSGIVKFVNTSKGSSDYKALFDDIQICYGSGASSGYTVSFDMKDHGSAIADIANVPSGSKIGAPLPEPTATDWDFGGWYKETECTNEWNFATDAVSANTTLYAKWSNCAPTITTHPVAANYNQNGVASALTVAANDNGGGTLHYQWWVKENDLADEDGSVIPGATGISFTPSTELLGTRYYYCVVSNDCGNVKTNTAEVTIRDTKPDPTAVWDVEEPTHGGKGFTFSVIAKNDDGTGLWDGTLTEEMLSVSSEAVLGTVTVNDVTKTISGTYGVKASATSPVTFYLLLPATETFAAKRLDYDRMFTACVGGDGSTYRVPVRKDSEKDASNNYRWVTAGAGEISYNYGSTISSGKATSSYNSFDSIVSSDKQNLYVRTYNANIKKVTLYVLTGGKDITVESIYKQTSYKGADDKDKLSTAAYSVTYDDGSDENTGAKGNHYIVITLEDPLDANDILMFKFSKTNVKAYGAVFTQTADDGTETPTLGWSPSIDGNVEKNENAADFTYTATRSNDEAVASLGIISYNSSNTTVATVNATTGQVTIADNIDFGSADHIDVTITATLSASGCYKKATTTYTLRVKKYVCSEAAGTIAVKSDDGCSKVLEITGYEAEATIQWYKDGVAIDGETETTYTATSGGAYYAITHKTCDAVSNELTISTAAATATKIVDSWYIKNGRRTPDIALVQTTNATGFTVTTGSPASDITSTGIGGCTFELKDDGIIYLHGTTSTGAAPSGMTPGDMTITITATACSNAAPLNIVLHIQPETAKPSVAFVVDGTLRKDGGSATSVSEAKTSDRPIWKYLANTFALTGCNAYWSVDSKELRQYYSQFDAILITDDPSTDTKGTGGVSYVKAFGTMVDVRPVLTMEAYVGKFKDGGWHVYDATPTSPNPRQVEMKLECKNHDIFKGLSPASSDNVRTTTDEYGNEYWHVIMVDTTLSPYHNTKDSYEALPALQGFDKTKFDHMLGVGTIFGEKLQAGVERQEEPAARMMILGIQNNAMAALTTEGKLVVKNALEYLLKTNMEDVNDCANYFTNADGDGQWSNGANWTRGEVPDFETRARILKPVTIGNGTTAIAARVDIAARGKSKHLGESCTGSITIAPQGVLKVGGKIRRAEAPYFGIDNLMPTENDDLYLTTNESYQSALIFDNSDGNTQAVVQVYSKAHKDGDNRYWQYLTSPLTQTPVTEFFYGIGTYTFKYDEAQNGWVRYNLGTTFEAFDAIGLTQNETKNFVFYGPLASTEDRELNLTNVHNGENMFGNSWTAPLQLTQFDDDDFEGEIEKTFYVYNTGFDAVEGTGASEDASNTPGEWQSIPLSSLEVLTGDGAWEGLKVVPAYQAFYVKCTSAGTITLNYDKHVRPATHDVNESLRAPKRAMSVKMDVLGMRISVENTSRRSSIYLLEDEDFTEGFDNGWDGDYFSGDANVSRFYSVSPLGRMAVSALPNLDGTALGFEPASMNEEYTFTFYCDEDKYYLNDLKMETSTPIRTGESYTFMSEEGDGANRFYISATPFASPQITTGSENLDAAAPKVQKIIYNDKLYIIRGGKVYSADGQVVK